LTSVPELQAPADSIAVPDPITRLHRSLYVHGGGDGAGLHNVRRSGRQARITALFPTRGMEQRRLPPRPLRIKRICTAWPARSFALRFGDPSRRRGVRDPSGGTVHQRQAQVPRMNISPSIRPATSRRSTRGSVPCCVDHHCRAEIEGRTRTSSSIFETSVVFSPSVTISQLITGDAVLALEWGASHFYPSVQRATGMHHRELASSAWRPVLTDENRQQLIALMVTMCIPR